MISPKEYALLNELGLKKKEVERQYELLSIGVQYSHIIRPAILNDGIMSLSKSELKKNAALYKKESDNIEIIKFIPASGAATRMFKELNTYLKTKIETPTIKELFTSFHKLAFSTLIPSKITKLEKASYVLNQLGYQSTPKGLIPFHSYNGFTRTPFKEHWIEGLYYASSKGKVKLHFTVSLAHEKSFEKIYKARITSFNEEHNTSLNISFSQQEKNTDTIIIDSNGNFLVDKKGYPLTRPGGHGALIQNLNNVKADLIFIKNIDNIIHQNHLKTTLFYKNALAGKLLNLRNHIFEQLLKIENGKADLTILESVGDEAHIQRPHEYNLLEDVQKVVFWKKKLNRPIRVCGMVKNEGEPGGGPFWVKKEKDVSLQIIESAEINQNDKTQTSIAQNSTHFNPVDLVCYLTDYKGNKFDLLNYVDKSAAFITRKSVNGQEVKVLEHPGLWNGAMANWITLFIEVPMTTFNPVKTVNDLLKSGHLP